MDRKVRYLSGRFKIRSYLRGAVISAATTLCVTAAPSPLPLLAEDPPTGVQITGITDIDFGRYNGSGDRTFEDQICIYNSESGDYRISFTVIPAGSFALQGDDPSQSIAFSLEYKTLPGGNYQSVSYGLASPLTVLGSASQSYPNCGNTMNAAYQITVTQTNLLNARPAIYSGTLTIFLEPEGAS